MTNVIIYLLASIGVSVQIYSALTRGLWWSPGGSLPTVALIGVILMGIGTAWSAVKGSSAAWIVFVGSLCCWAFYIPGLSTLLDMVQRSIAQGKLSFASVDVYLPLLSPALLLVATATAVMNGPMGKKHE